MAAGVYLHIPFCKSRCSYCDFATDVYRSGEVVERYVAALCGEIGAFTGESRPDPDEVGSDLLAADTIYFGGGTPSLLRPDQVEGILNSVNGKFEIDTNTEITMEMNPATVTAETLAGYRSIGVNRASFGVQTFDDRDLKLLARGHNADDARRTFELLNDAGFANISFDLIIGLPGQSVEAWRRNLDEAVKMDPRHLSLYLLEIQEGTPLAEQIRSERRPMPDEEIAATMYELMQDRVTDAGFEQYEISNFAKPGFQSRHNTKYWRLDPVYGFGVSSHSFDGHMRYANERDTAEYVRRIEQFGTAEVRRDRVDAASEYVFLGLRMTDGIDVRDYQKRFGTDLKAKFASELDRLSDAGLIEFEGDRLRLTARGMLYSNEVFAVFV